MTDIKYLELRCKDCDKIIGYTEERCAKIHVYCPACNAEWVRKGE